jgi:folylpolyglutamate synthase/dihydropteroate synthase
VRAIAPLADAGYATAVDSVRARPVSEVADALTAAGVPTETFDSVAEALDAARATASEDDLILVTGSLYTVADARRVLVGGSGA